MENLIKSEMKDFNGVTFRVNGTVYAVDALKIREIVGGAEWKPLSVEGESQSFIQLRGKTVPVLDLREKFGFVSLPTEGLNSFITVQGPGSDRGSLTALRVDAVLDMIKLSGPDLKPLPESSHEAPARYLQAHFSREEESGYVLHVESVLEEGFSRTPELLLENKAS